MDVMIEKDDKRSFEALLDEWLRGTIGESDHRRLLDIIGNDPGVDSWLAGLIDAQPAEIDPEVSRRMLDRIHASIDTDSKDREERNLARLRRRTMWTKISRVAAMIALPLAASFATWRVVTPDDPGVPVEVTVDRGEKAAVTLPDGSKVWLNSASRLSYSPESWRRERNVNLTGEAYFEVRPDSRRPFTVATDKLSVKVLGTKFNVKAYPDDAVSSSTLVEGSVEVTTPDGSYAIEPGWQVGYDAARNVTTSPARVDTDACIAWIDNQLVFTDQTFEQIIASVERMYNIDVVFTSESIRSRRFSGTLPNNGLREFLEVISISSPVCYLVKDGQVYLSEDPGRIGHFR